MPFVQRIIEPKYLSRTSLFNEDGTPLVTENELIAVTNNTLSNALRQLASLVLAANDIFSELGSQFQEINKRSETLKEKINILNHKVTSFDPKKVAVPESDICSFAQLKDHYKSRHILDEKLFSIESRPTALKELYEAAVRTPVHVMRQLDRWRRDGHRSSRFFLCTPVLGAKRKKVVNLDIETQMPLAVEELRKWTSNEALGDITVTPDCINKINNTLLSEGGSIDEIDHKLPSPEEQLKVVALKFPAEIIAVDVSGRSFDRMSVLRQSFLNGDVSNRSKDTSNVKRKTKTRRPRNRRRNTLAGTDQKEIQSAITAGEEQSALTSETESIVVPRSRSSDILRPSKKETVDKKSHFNTLKQWGKTQFDRLLNKSAETKVDTKEDSVQDVNVYETVAKRVRDVDKPRFVHERNPSISSSEKSSVSVPIATAKVNVKLRESSTQRWRRRSGDNKDEPHSSSGNWSASSESGRASIGSEITITTQLKSTTSTTNSNNSLNIAPSSVSSARKRFNSLNNHIAESVTSEGTLTPDIIHDLHEDGETSSIYSCDTEGYYTSFHMDSGLKTLREEELPCVPLHFTSAFSNSEVNKTATAENEYELFGKGSTSTTASSAGTVCTTLLATDSRKSLIMGPAVPERKSSLSNNNNSPNNSLDKNKSNTIKRSPASSKPVIVALIHKRTDDDLSPDSGHNTSSSPIESINSPNGLRSGSEYDYSECSDLEGSERIKVKTTINSSRIPSMCVITPPHSDDESNNNHNYDEDNNNHNILIDRKLDYKINVSNAQYKTHIISSADDQTNTLSLVNVNCETGYAIVQTLDSESEPNNNRSNTNLNSFDTGTNMLTTGNEPLRKPTTLNLTNNLNKCEVKPETSDTNDDFGEYVTIADVNFAIGKQDNKEVQYVSLNELPIKETTNKTNNTSTNSLEKKKKQGAHVTLDADGKVLYSSDSLNRRKYAHTTFEPGPFIKASNNLIQNVSPVQRNQASVRPIQLSQKQRVANIPQTEFNRPLSPQRGKIVIKAISGTTSPTSEIIRMPASTIVPSTRPMSPKPISRGAYVHMEESGQSITTIQEKGRVVYPPLIGYQGAVAEEARSPQNMYEYKEPMPGTNMMTHHKIGLPHLNYFSPIYQTRPEVKTERGNYTDYQPGYSKFTNQYNKKLGIAVQIPQVDLPKVSDTYRRMSSPQNISNFDENKTDALRISPIDPRNTGEFQTSTPSNKQYKDLKAAANLENQMFSPKKSTMSNEELYAIIHKSKKKMNIGAVQVDSVPTSPGSLNQKRVESGYIDPKKKSKDEFNSQVDNIRHQQNAKCDDRKGVQQTSRMDFKRLLLQKSNVLFSNSKKLSAVEQLRMSKEQIKSPPPESTNSDMKILNLSGSPRAFTNRKSHLVSSPRHIPEKTKTPPKIMSPRSQWRFANPRTDVLSSTILEDHREYETKTDSPPQTSRLVDTENRVEQMSISKRNQAQRAKFFDIDSNRSINTHTEQNSHRLASNKSTTPALETAF